MRSALYTGTLVHVRRAPARHVFRYPVSYWLFDLDELPELERRLQLFSWNRRNLVTLHDRDHFDDDGRPLKEKVVSFCAALQPVCVPTGTMVSPLIASTFGASAWYGLEPPT